MKTSRPPLIPRWTVGLARKNFAGLLKAAERQPQEIYHRQRLQAVVVNPSMVRDRRADGLATVAPRNLWEATEPIRREAAKTGYVLPFVKRRNRPNALLKILTGRSR